MLKFRSNKEKRITLKSAFLTIGSLTLLVGAPISLVISCSDALANVDINKIAASITSITDIKPNADGEFTEEIVGWDIIATSEDAVGELNVQKLTSLKPGDKYLIQFTLKDGYSALNVFNELIVDPTNENVYYSEVFTFTITSQILVQSEIDLLKADSNANISEKFTGWETVEVVSSEKDSTTNKYVPFVNLAGSDEYKLKFTLSNNYIISFEIDEGFLVLENESYYTTKTYLFENVAESITNDKLNSIYITDNGEITKEFTGWEISVVDSKKIDQEVLEILVHDTIYFLKFTLKTEFTEPSTLGELTLNQDGSYYSNLKTYVKSVVASDITGLTNIIPSETGIISKSFTGWNINVIDSIESNTILNSLEVDTTYLLKFTLQDGYLVPTEIDGLIFNANGSYYSLVRTFSLNAENLFNTANIVPNSLGEVSESFNGWDISIVHESDLDVSINSLTASTAYLLRFTLKTNYLLPNERDGLFFNSINGSYYSSVRTFEVLAENLTNTINIIPNKLGVVSESFTGWDIDVVDSVESNIVLDSLEDDTTYLLRFTLKSGYLVPSEIDGLASNENGAYYSSARVLDLSAANLFNTDSIVPNSFGEVSESFKGWDISVVHESDLDVSINSLTANTAYIIRFTLKPDYLLPDERDGLFFNPINGSYYSRVHIFKVLAENLTNTINIIPNKLGVVYESFTGWDIDIVDSVESNTVLNSLSVDTIYLLRFTLKSGYLVPSKIDGLASNENGAYYSNTRAFDLSAADLIDTASIIPNSLGQVTETLDGWDITVVDSIESNTVLNFLDANTPYILRFELREGFALPIELDRLFLNANGSYYSNERDFIINAENLSNIDNIIPNRFGIVSETFVGWDIKAVDGIISDTRVLPLIANKIYYLKFTLKVGYALPIELDGLTLNDNGSYYSEERTLKEDAESLTNTANIIPNEFGIVSENFIGWDITVVDGSILDKIVDSLTIHTIYYLKFTLKNGYLPPTELDGLFSSTNGSYYSEERIFKVNAENLINIDIVIPNTSGVISEIFTGWDISVVTDIESDTNIDYLSAGSRYILKFTLKEDYLVPSEIGGLILNANGSYYTNVQNFDVIAENIIDLANIIPTWSGDIFESFNGWDIDVVDSIRSDKDIYSMFADKLYILKFTLKYGYLLPNEIDGLTLNDNGFYYSESRTFKVDADNSINTENIIPNSLGHITVAFLGWNITVVDSRESDTLLNSLIANTSYSLKFTLKPGYILTSEMDGLVLDANESYYSGTRTFKVDAETLIDPTNITPNAVGEFSESFIGWDLTIADIVVKPLEILELGTRYRVVFTLQPGYLGPNKIQYMNTHSVPGVFYTYIKTYEILAENLVNTNKITPNSIGVLPVEFDGWKISVVEGDGSGTIIDSFIPNDSYFLKFALLENYLAPANIDNLNLHSNGFYYSDERTFKVVAANIDVTDSLIPNTSGRILETFEGWYVEVVDINHIVQRELGPTDEYWIRFKLKPGYTKPEVTNGISMGELSEGWYWTSVRIFPGVFVPDPILIPSDQIDTDFVDDFKVGLDARIDFAFTGWDITIVDNDNNQLDTIETGQVHYILFLLQDGYSSDFKSLLYTFEIVSDADGNKIGYRTYFDRIIESRQAAVLSEFVISNLYLTTATGDFSEIPLHSLDGWIVVAHLNRHYDWVISESNPITRINSANGYIIYLTLDVNAGYRVSVISGVTTADDITYSTPVKFWDGATS